MNRIRKIAISLLLMCLVLSQSLVVFAADDGKGLDRLVEITAKDKVTSTSVSSKGGTAHVSSKWDYSKKTYKCSDGGYKIYTELATKDVQKPINENNLKQLTIGAKNEFLTDYYNAGQSVIEGCKANNYSGGITEEVGTNWLERIQNTAGVGSQLLTTLMSNTKPDFISANRIYEPFSGTVGTILGVISVVLMALLSLTMVLDISYIAIPAFQLMVDNDGDGKGGGGKKKSFISLEAINAVAAVEGSQGGGGQSGDSKKLAIGIYFKSRVAMLIVLCICLLYLISGNIFAFIGWFIDLFSGFLGF